MEHGKSRIKNENYIVIQGWMVNELQLKGNELMIYALIYGFSQAEDQWYNGSLLYLANWTNSTKQGVMKALKSLLSKDLIEKKEKYINNVKFCSYRCKSTSKHETPYTKGTSPDVCNKVSRGIEQSSMGYATKFNAPMQQSLPNNIQDTNYNNIDKKHTPKKENMCVCKNHKTENDLNNKSEVINNTNKNHTQNNVCDTETAFEQIYSIYPKKQNKIRALQEFKKAIKKKNNVDSSYITLKKIFQGIKNFIRYINAKKIDVRFVPTLGNWLKDERWNDQYDLTKLKTVTEKKNRFANFEQRTWDFEKIERIAQGYYDD